MKGKLRARDFLSAEVKPNRNIMVRREKKTLGCLRLEIALTQSIQTMADVYQYSKKSQFRSLATILILNALLALIIEYVKWSWDELDTHWINSYANVMCQLGELWWILEDWKAI